MPHPWTSQLWERVTRYNYVCLDLEAGRGRGGQVQSARHYTSSPTASLSPVDVRIRSFRMKRYFLSRGWR